MFKGIKKEERSSVKSEATDASPVLLMAAPLNKPLRIVEIAGGEGLRRKLMAMGFHKGAFIELDSQAIFKGPILVRHLTGDTRTALGRGIARKIVVEVLDGGK